MGIVDIGNQIITYDYKQEAIAEDFNRLNHNLLPRGIYSGGTLSKVSDVSINIAPLTCSYTDSTNNVTVRIETTTTANISISAAKPYVVLKYTWLNTEINYAEFLTKDKTEIVTDDLILGKGDFNGSTLEDFDYSRKSWSVGYYEDYSNRDFPFKVIATDPYSVNVTVMPGKMFFDSAIVEIATDTTSPDFILPVGVLGRRDIIAINKSSVLVILQGDESAGLPLPTVSASYVPLAIINFPANATEVHGSYIEHIYPSTYKGPTDTSSGGGGSGINVGYNFTNGQFETDASGWNTYADAAGTEPVDGTGGTATALTFVSSSSTPLTGLRSGLLSKAASNAQGQGLSYDFTIDRGVRQDPVKISLVYETSSNYVSGDMGFYIYDIDSSLLLRPSIVSIPATATTPANFIATFYISYTSTNFRAIFHVATTSALAYTFKIDDIIVGNLGINIGAVISNEIAYTPTFTGFGTPTNVNFIYVRRGTKIFIQGKFTSGTSTATEARISLPSGLTSDASIGTLQTCGRGSRDIATSNDVTILMEPSVSYVTFGTQGATAPLTKQNGTAILSSGQNLSFQCELPISTWSSNVNLASDTQEYVFNTQSVINTNDTTSFGYGSGGAAILANTALTTYNCKFINPIQNTDLIIVELRSKVTGRWIPLFCANYSMSGYWIGLSNTSMVYTAGHYGIGLNSTIDSYTVKITFGQYAATVNAVSNLTWATVIGDSTYGYDRWRIRKISNGNMAEVPPIVAATYTKSSAAITANNPIDIPTKVDDTHNAVTTGVAWKFTAPISGRYLFTGGTSRTVSAGGNIFIYKNGNSYLTALAYAVSGSTQSFAHSLYLNTGDYVDFRCDSSITVDFRVEILRIGG